MDDNVIVLDSDDEDTAVQVVVEAPKPAVKRTASTDVNGFYGPSSKIRRVQPTKVGEVAARSSKDKPETLPETEGLSVESFSGDNEKSANDTGSACADENDDDIIEVLPESKEPEAGPSKPSLIRNSRTQELQNLVEACRNAEPSQEMKTIIKAKLMKYYHSVHPDFVTSKNFLRSLKAVTEDIKREPHLVYTSLKVVIDELNARRKSKATVLTNEENVDGAGTGDAEKDARLKVLYRALVKCKRMITDLDETEVDWEEDDNSSYLKKVRFEKRAVEIYAKICEITGESSSAYRIVKKPIVFKDTDFPEFNKKLQRLVNKKNSFPNFRDVLKLFDYCNKTYEYKLLPEQQRRIAQDAFEKLGKKLQQRRKNDLYETTTFYVGKTKDPAKDDPELKIRLEKNKKNYAKYDDIINDFAAKEFREHGQSDVEEVSSTSKTEPADEAAKGAPTPETKPVELTEHSNKNGNATTTRLDDDDDLVIIS